MAKWRFFRCVAFSPVDRVEHFTIVHRCDPPHLLYWPEWINDPPHHPAIPTPIVPPAAGRAARALQVAAGRLARTAPPAERLAMVALPTDVPLAAVKVVPPKAAPTSPGLPPNAVEPGRNPATTFSGNSPSSRQRSSALDP
ncbi:MAG: hypothetical protein C0478_01385 [Planctomyces sp.]|nr:hypothetical protein [Planctomyces sp.]